MSVLTYDGIQLPYASTTNFMVEPQMDEEGGVDWYCTKYSITVQCLIGRDYIGMLNPSVSANAINAADVMRSIEKTLMQPRKRLSFTFNGVDMIPQQTAQGGPVDAKNGPIPQHFRFLQLTNEMFIVEYSIVAHYWSNPVTDPAGSPVTLNDVGSAVLYNRWSESVEIDNLNFVKRTRQGKYVIRSDNAEGITADQIRERFAVLGVPPGFLRESSSYTLDPSGLALSYSVTDKEVFKMPPRGAFEADGWYREETTRLGVRVIGTCYVLLKGDKGTDQGLLLKTALGICLGKFARRQNEYNFTVAENRTDRIISTWGFLESAYVKHEFYRNEVEVMATFSFVTATKSAQDDTLVAHKVAIAGFNNLSTFVPRSDEQGEDAYTPFYTTRGSALSGPSILLQAAAYYDPSLQGNALDQNTGQMNNGTEIGKAGRNGEA